MNIQNLKVGMRIPNYKTLCNILDIEVRSGNSRISDLKLFGEAVEYNKEGNAFIINAIKVNNIVKKRNSRNTPKHVAYMKLLLLDLLKEDESTKYYSTTTLATTLHLIGANYQQLFNCNRNILSDNTGVSLEALDEFHCSISGAYKSTIKTILKQLEDSGAIIVDKVTMITVEDSKGKKNHMPATNIEKKQMLKIKKECANELGFKLSELYQHHSDYQYRKLLKSRLKEQMNIVYYYKAYEIESLKESLIEEYDLLLQEEMIDKTVLNSIRMFLKNKILEEWNKSNMKRFQGRRNKAFKEFTFGEPKDDIKIRINDDYIEEMQMLCNIFIRDKIAS